MPRRVFALVLMMATMASPLALALCRVECATATASHAHAARHSCHESSAPAAVSLTAVPHACGHLDEAPAGLEHALQTLDAPAVLPALPSLAPPAIVERVAAVEIQHSPPGSLPVISQLRV